MFIAVRAMIDSGATWNFISQLLVKEHEIPGTNGEPPALHTIEGHYYAPTKATLPVRVVGMHRDYQYDEDTFHRLSWRSLWSGHQTTGRVVRPPPILSFAKAKRIFFCIPTDPKFKFSGPGTLTASWHESPCWWSSTVGSV